MKRIVMFASSLVLLGAGVARAGTIAPDLSALLDRMGDTEVVSTIVMLSDQVDLQALNQELDSMHATRAYRHRQVVLALQEMAGETQGGLIVALKNGMTDGRVVSYKTVWISNLAIVEAEKGFIEELAARPDVGDIYFDYEIEPIEPMSMEKAPDGLIASIEEGLQRINAPAAWARGYTGAGRIVSHLDTGADGNHPAFAARWRGLHEPSEECWYDPVTNTDFPQEFYGSYHGTHTMGTMCGYTIATNDHIGVAYDAEWISAAVIDRVNIPTTIADAITAFEWTAEPDGDPYTIDDVPDVSSNSWGISPIFHSAYLDGPCDQVFWTVLDGCEAAGVVVVQAAGNEGNYGPPNEVRNPANRAVDPFRSFSIGAIDGANYGSNPIAWFSSRGPVPGDCGSYTTKPEVCAPGVHVRSSYPGGGYIYLDGTSMATPHVAGAVALLRQADPNATSEQIKSALMESAQDLGPAGEENTYGWGLINVDAAIDIILATACSWDMICTPNGEPIVIPPEGGSLSFDLSLTNICDFSRTVDIWTMVELPDGRKVGPYFFFQNIPFTPDQVRSATGLTGDVPGRAPAGTYTVRTYVGDYPTEPQDNCSFQFEKAALTGGITSGNREIGAPDGRAETAGDPLLQVIGWEANDFMANGEEGYATR